MTVPMPNLTRAPNGDYFARKAIPADVRDAYAAAYGVRREALFRLSAGGAKGQAATAYTEWLLEVQGRINRLRAAARGEAVVLSQRELHALAARWYLWFTRQHGDNPGTRDQWQHAADEMQHVWESGLSGMGDPEDESEEIGPAHRRRIRAKLAELAQLQSFLATEAHAISTESIDTLLDGPLRREFGAALSQLMKMAEGDYRPDPRAADAEQTGGVGTPRDKKLAGLTVWSAFEAWVRERKPEASTVNRWRACLEDLDAFAGKKDLALFTGDDAVRWKDTLVTEKRSARVANEVWLTAAHKVFQWAKDNKKVTENPFDGVKVAVPRKSKTERKREFTDEEIAIILRASLATQSPRLGKGLRDAYRWLPWICAYTGARAGEIAQLRKEDISQHELGWVMQITPEAGSVKGAVPREVVLHEHLIAQGFIDFVQRATEGPLFYSASQARAEEIDPTKPPRPPYVVLRQKIADWVRRIGVTAPNVSPTHSWRHTFKRRARRAGIEESLRDAICGHADGRAKATYETPTVEDLAAAIALYPRYEVESL